MSNKYIKMIKHHIKIQRLLSLLPIHCDVIGILKNYILDYDEINECFIIAAKFGYLEIVKYFHQNGVNISADNNCAFESTIRNGHLEVVKYFHENGANIKTVDSFAIIWADYNGYFDIVNYFCENGGDITI
jgi:ankyrin repeat protein